MRRTVPRILALLIALTGLSNVASAATIQIGVLSFDEGTEVGSTFDITNLTGDPFFGGAAFPPDFPLMTPLTIGVTQLIAELSGGGTLTIDGSAFSVVDPQGDVNCTVAGDAGDSVTPGCDVAAYAISSATLIGTLSPTTGLLGLPPGYVGIETAFTATITPGSGTTLMPGDFAIINATLVADQTAVPEPPAASLLTIGLIGLVACSVTRQRMQTGPPVSHA